MARWNCSAARYPAFERCNWSCGKMRFLYLSTSSCGKVGLRITSANNSRVWSRFSTRPPVVTVLVRVDSPEFAVSVAPSASTFSAMSLLERVFVPSRSNVAVVLETPRYSGLSASPPVNTTICMLKVGTLSDRSRMTCNPFFSVASSARGSLTFNTSLLTGALPLITAPFVLGGPWICLPPWARASDDTSASRISAATTLFLFFMILIGITPLLSGRAGWGGLGFWHSDYDRAVRVDQILVRNALHIFFRDGGDFIQSRVNQARIVVVDGVLAQRDRTRQRALQAVDEITPGGVLGFLKFPVGNRFFLETVHLRVDNRCDVVNLNVRPHSRSGVKAAD